MRGVRSKAILGALASLISSLCAAEEGVPRIARNVLVAQTSMGAPELSAPSSSAAPPPAQTPFPASLGRDDAADGKYADSQPVASRRRGDFAF
jgi:hypothetical protein